MRDVLDRNKLLETLKFKIETNSSYFVVVKDIHLDDIDIEKNAMLLPSSIIPVSDIAYLNVLYRYNWDKKHIEGVVAIDLEDLTDLVINKTVIVYYTGQNSKDAEIYDRILKEK